MHTVAYACMHPDGHLVQGWNVAAVYCLDAQFASDGAKFVAGALQALSAMVQLELPHINVLTKVDLLSEESKASCLVLQWSACTMAGRGW